MTIYGLVAEGKKPSLKRARWVIMKLNTCIPPLQIIKLIRGLMDWDLHKTKAFYDETIAQGVEPME